MFLRLFPFLPLPFSVPPVYKAAVESLLAPLRRAPSVMSTNRPDSVLVLSDLALERCRSVQIGNASSMGFMKRMMYTSSGNFMFICDRHKPSS